MTLDASTSIRVPQFVRLGHAGARFLGGPRRAGDPFIHGRGGRYSGPRWLHRFGVELRSLSADYEYTSTLRYEPGGPYPGFPGLTVDRDLAPEPAGDHVAAYATSRIWVTDRLAAEIGLRWDEQTYAGDAHDQWSPRLNLVYEAGSATRLRASWGRYTSSRA